MADRRTLGDSLEMTPSQKAFIQGNGGAQPIDAAPIVTNERATAEEPVQKTSRPKRPARPRAAGSELPVAKSLDSETPYIDQILVPLTTRIRPETANALKRVCLEQKLSRRRPDSAQEIVDLALSHWLAQNGFLD
jgi:hypothetical protein